MMKSASCALVAFALTGTLTGCMTSLVTVPAPTLEAVQDSIRPQLPVTVIPAAPFAEDLPPPVYCEVTPGTLRHSLEQIGQRNGEAIFWRVDGEIMLEVTARITADSHVDCIDRIITSLQRDGSNIRAIGRDNGILITGR